MDFLNFTSGLKYKQPAACNTLIGDFKIKRSIKNIDNNDDNKLIILNAIQNHIKTNTLDIGVGVVEYNINQYSFNDEAFDQNKNKFYNTITNIAKTNNKKFVKINNNYELIIVNDKSSTKQYLIAFIPGCKTFSFLFDNFDPTNIKNLINNKITTLQNKEKHIAIIATLTNSNADGKIGLNMNKPIYIGKVKNTNILQPMELYDKTSDQNTKIEKLLDSNEDDSNEDSKYISCTDYREYNEDIDNNTKIDIKADEAKAKADEAKAEANRLEKEGIFNDYNKAEDILDGYNNRKRHKAKQNLTKKLAEKKAKKDRPEKYDKNNVESLNSNGDNNNRSVKENINSINQTVDNEKQLNNVSNIIKQSKNNQNQEKYNNNENKIKKWNEEYLQKNSIIGKIKRATADHNSLIKNANLEDKQTSKNNLIALLKENSININNNNKNMFHYDMQTRTFVSKGGSRKNRKNLSKKYIPSNLNNRHTRKSKSSHTKTRKRYP
jgi:hypothetical protein